MTQHCMTLAFTIECISEQAGLQSHPQAADITHQCAVCTSSNTSLYVLLFKTGIRCPEFFVLQTQTIKRIKRRHWVVVVSEQQTWTAGPPGGPGVGRASIASNSSLIVSSCLVGLTAGLAGLAGPLVTSLVIDWRPFLLGCMCISHDQPVLTQYSSQESLQEAYVNHYCTWGLDCSKVLGINSQC